MSRETIIGAMLLLASLLVPIVFGLLGLGGPAMHECGSGPYKYECR
ncbi:MAG TPA: hypothetical protein VNH21_03170 [Steroidobacteraceae bacterium]|nr:hypothetical protein [Steroidobacteraceae bacterium]